MDRPHKRLDALLVERGLCSGRERAKEQIRSGNVFVNGRPETKPSALIDPAAELCCEGGCTFNADFVNIVCTGFNVDCEG